MLKGLGNLEDAILSSLFGVISSKREDMENKWKNTQKLKKIKTMFTLSSYLLYCLWWSGLDNYFLFVLYTKKSAIGIGYQNIMRSLLSLREFESITNYLYELFEDVRNKRNVRIIYHAG